MAIWYIKKKYCHEKYKKIFSSQLKGIHIMF